MSTANHRTDCGKLNSIGLLKTVGPLFTHPVALVLALSLSAPAEAVTKDPATVNKHATAKGAKATSSVNKSKGTHAAQVPPASGHANRPTAKTAAHHAAPVPRATVAAPKTRGPSDAFLAIPSYLQTVEVATTPGGNRLGQSISLAVRDQYLLLPLDFVLSAGIARSDIHFYVGSTLEAHLVDLDLSANLALMRVDQPLPSTLPQTQIRTSLPMAGELLAFVDVKDSLRGGPRFLGTIRDGDNIRYQILTNQETKTGGFLFDRAGRLVSVVPAAAKSREGLAADDKDNLRTWSSSTQAIFEILRRQETPKPASASGLEDKHRQLLSWQERWAQSLVSAPHMLSTGQLDCHSQIANLTDESIASQIRQMNAMDCETKTILPLGGKYTAGLELKSGHITLRGAAMSDQDTLQLAKTFASGFFAELEQSSKQVNLLTTEQCHESKVTTQQGRPVQVKFCTSALKADQGLNDTVIAVSGTDTSSHAYVVAAHLRGFDQSNTKKVMDALIENGGSLK